MLEMPIESDLVRPPGLVERIQIRTQGSDRPLDRVLYELFKDRESKPLYDLGDRPKLRTRAQRRQIPFALAMRVYQRELGVAKRNGEK